MGKHRGKAPALFLCKMGGSVWEGVNVGKQLEMLQKEQSSILEERRGTDDEKGKPGPVRSVFGSHITGLVLTALQQVKGVGVTTQLTPGP